ncbi:hypothetical protein [Thalassotalea sp. PS06]|uniref:hypothetical protein n=1 Tax=Thalassotalea sp. PS06 TaxID=2594005 RepID=UPI001163C2E1|nr:hypothetical protein [Thalassotalea sp. PS06]QDP00759.1 hypothetical protein FNC98_04965 [Thalassotalea sp. PS06]
MNDYFDSKRLFILTALLSCLSLFTYMDDEIALVTVFLAGFLYSAVLWFSLKVKPEFWRFELVTLVLGVSNVLSTFASAPLVFLPKPVNDFLAIVFASIFGAVVTLLCLSKVWKLKFSREKIILIIALISIASIGFSSLNLYIRNNLGNYGVTALINSMMWWWAFSLGLLFSPRKFWNTSFQARNN